MLFLFALAFLFRHVVAIEKEDWRKAHSAGLPPKDMFFFGTVGGSQKQEKEPKPKLEQFQNV